MRLSSQDHLDRVLERLRQVQRTLGNVSAPGGADARLADELDSMGLVELVALLAEDCGVTPDAIEKAVQHRFGTTGELAEALALAGLTVAAGLQPADSETSEPAP